MRRTEVRSRGTVAAGSADGYFSMVLAVREAVLRKRACRANMKNGALLQEIFPMSCKCCMSTTSARTDVQCSKKLQLVVQHPGSGSDELTTLVENMNGSSMVIAQESNLNGQGKHECKKQLNSSNGWHFTSQQRNQIPVGSNYQAQMPQWTGVLPVNYNDPETLKWLGTKVWPLENGNRKYHFTVTQLAKVEMMFVAATFHDQ